jgi:hypothetical protein
LNLIFGLDNYLLKLIKMKKLLSLAMLIIATGAYAQKIAASKLPAAVTASFAKHYPGATAKWEKEEGKYEPGFKLNGKEASAVFDASGVMEESEIEINSSELPAPAAEYIKTHYKGATVKELAKITKTNGEVNYEAAVKGKDLIFDAAGKFLKEVKD